MAGYTVLTTAEIQRMLSTYDLGSLLAAEQMKGGQANSSYKVTTESGLFILSVCDEKDAEEIRGLMSILSHLQHHGFPTSRPVPTRAGSLALQFQGKPVYLKEYINGAVVRDLSAEQLFNLGQVVARLHTIPAPEGIPDCFPYGLDSFRDVSDLNGVSDRGDLKHPYLSWFRERVLSLETTIDPAMDRCFIHGDIYWDNLIFSGDSLVALLDFEEACCYYRLYDLGVCAVGCCSGEQGLEMEKLQALLRGYQLHYLLTNHQRAQLKVFIEYAGVAGSYWRFRQYNIRHPSLELQDSYRELSFLADQIRGMADDEFLSYCTT